MFSFFIHQYVTFPPTEGKNAIPFMVNRCRGRQRGAQCAGPSVQEPSVHDSDASVQLVGLESISPDSNVHVFPVCEIPSICWQLKHTAVVSVIDNCTKNNSYISFCIVKFDAHIIRICILHMWNCYFFKTLTLLSASYLSSGIMVSGSYGGSFTRPVSIAVDSGCRTTVEGSYYTGRLDTVGSKRCLPWSDYTEHHDDQFPDRDKAAAKSYCRAVASLSYKEPWCYTEHGPRACDVPLCPGKKSKCLTLCCRIISKNWKIQPLLKLNILLSKKTAQHSCRQKSGYHYQNRTCQAIFVPFHHRQKDTHRPQAVAKEISVPYYTVPVLN